MVSDRPKDYFSEFLYTQSNLQCERHFLATGGQNLPISNKVITRSWHFTYRNNVPWGIWLWHLFLSNDKFWTVLGHPRGQWGTKGQKLFIPLKVTPRTWKFEQRYKLWSQIFYCHSFTTNHNFWTFLGYPSGQKGSKIAHFFKSNSPEAANFHRENISHQRFDTVTHLGQMKSFDPFWGHPRHQIKLSI